jgi:hypothetical protein
MHDDAAMILADVGRFLESLVAQQPDLELFLVVPEQLAVDCAREADRIAFCQTFTDADGALHIKVLEVREGVELNFEQREFLFILNNVKLVKQVPLRLPALRAPRDVQGERMALLRKFTGQDWRGRRG